MDIFPDPHWGRMPIHKPHIAELVAHERPRNHDDKQEQHSDAYYKRTGCELYHDCLTCHVKEDRCARWE